MTFVEVQGLCGTDIAFTIMQITEVIENCKVDCFSFFIPFFSAAEKTSKILKKR